MQPRMAMQVLLGATTHATTAAATNGPEVRNGFQMARSDGEFLNTKNRPSDPMTQFCICYFGKETLILQTII